MSDGDQYRVRATTFQGREVSVVLQNVNGPCPLLALANILLLRGSISIHADFSHVGYDRLVTLIGDFLMEGNNRQSVPPAMAANYEQNVFDALEQMPFLQFGFDVNVRFDGIEGFEFTSGMSVFDLFNIRLVHGWLYEASDEQVVAAIGSSTYNELTEKLVELDNMRSGAAENTEGIRRYGIIECFLQESASQLTVEGIQRLRNDLAEHELAIFFRNNHFSVIHKHQGDLYLLVTDQGFLYQKKIVWERLEHVHGATAFTDAEFKLYNPENDYTEQPASVVTPADADQAAALAQAACDEELALRLQREEEASRSGAEPSTFDADRKLAEQLHQEELQRQGGPATAAAAPPADASGPVASPQALSEEARRLEQFRQQMDMQRTQQVQQANQDQLRPKEPGQSDDCTIQ